MAAFDTPWMASMSSDSRNEDGQPSPTNAQSATVAAFSPNYTPNSPSFGKQRSTILVHQKSPLLVATPPQITRALAYSHPFLLPLNKIAGLLSWSTGDPWESFLLLSFVWAITIYGDIVMRWAGPLVIVLVLILGLWLRRYSPLSSTGWMSERGGKGHLRKELQGKVRHHKSLDEIVETLKTFTSRCNVLLDPYLRMTDFLSTQQTATGATTRPALTAMFIRISIVSPIWYLLTLPPFYIITTKRVILVLETLFLTWHSGPTRVARSILWRSRSVRRFSAAITGLDFGEAGSKPKLPPRAHEGADNVAANLAPAELEKTRRGSAINFTFVLHENQRRWLGIGWTQSMLAYERASWTDEYLNASQPTDSFELPKVEGGHAKWRWAEGSEWEIEGADAEPADGKAERKPKDGGWIYYDNHWRDGRRGQDGWSRYTRRRKWVRDAELVEVTQRSDANGGADGDASDDGSTTAGASLRGTASPIVGSPRKTGWLRKRERTDSKASQMSSGRGAASQPDGSGSGDGSFSLAVDRDDESGDDAYVPPHLRVQTREADWGVGDDLSMELG